MIIYLQLITPLSSQQKYNFLPQPVVENFTLPNILRLIPVDDEALRDEDVQVTLLLSFAVPHMPQ